MLSDSSELQDQFKKKSSRGSFSLKKLKNRQNNGSFGGPFTVIASVLAIFITSQLIAVLLVTLFLRLSVGEGRLGDLNESTPTQFAYIALAEGTVILLVLQLLKSRGLSLSSIGLGRRLIGSDIVKALLGFGVFYGLLIIVGLILAALAPDFKTDQPQDVGFKNLRTALDPLLAFAALVFFPPVAEEILTRGYLYSGLRSHWRFVPAMLVTSLIFAVAHLPGSSGLVWGAAINTFVLSIVLVYLRERTGALYAGMLLHAMNNLVAFGVHFNDRMF